MVRRAGTVASGGRGGASARRAANSGVPTGGRRGIRGGTEPGTNPPHGHAKRERDVRRRGRIRSWHRPAASGRRRCSESEADEPALPSCGQIRYARDYANRARTVPAEGCSRQGLTRFTAVRRGGFAPRALSCLWRRDRDSDPRYGFPYTRFPSAPVRPLRHPSACVVLPFVPIRRPSGRHIDKWGFERRAGPDPRAARGGPARRTDPGAVPANGRRRRPRSRPASDSVAGPPARLPSRGRLAEG